MKSKIGRPKARGELHAANVLLEKSQYAKLQELSLRSGFSVNQIIRQAVEAYLVKSDKSSALNNLVAHHLVIYPHPRTTDEHWHALKPYDKWFIENFNEERGLTVREVGTGYICSIAVDQIKRATRDQLELTCQILFHPKVGVRFIPLSIGS